MYSDIFRDPLRDVQFERLVYEDQADVRGGLAGHLSYCQWMVQSKSFDS